LLELDFLNPKRPVPAGEKWRRRVRTGAIVAGVVLAAAIATDATLYLRKCDEYATREAVVDELKAELKRYLEIENKVEEVEDWQYAAVWPDHLLWLTENAVEPGKDMLVQQIALNGRTASITVKKMLAKHLDVAHEYASKLDGLVVEEQRPYRAELGGWGKQRQRDAQFEWVGDVRVELLELKKHIEERDDRVKQRRNKLKLRGL
jgi:hypothetical protein